MWRTLLVVVSAILPTLAYFPYIRAIIKGKGAVRPNRASWFTWCLVDAGLVISLAAAGEWSAVPMFAVFTLGSAAVLILSIKGGEGGFTPLDLSCIAVAVLGIIVWRLFAVDAPIISVTANVVALIMGGIPTIAKTYKDPASEDALTWRIFLAGGLASLLAVPTFTYAALVSPLAVVSVQAGINLAMILGKKK
jgi:hypothetical protein